MTMRNVLLDLEWTLSSLAALSTMGLDTLDTQIAIVLWVRHVTRSTNQQGWKTFNGFICSDMCTHLVVGSMRPHPTSSYMHFLMRKGKQAVQTHAQHDSDVDVCKGQKRQFLVESDQW